MNKLVKDNFSKLDFFETVDNLLENFKPFSTYWQPFTISNEIFNSNFDQDDKNYFVKATVPGFKEKDIKVLVTDNQITIEGNKTFDEEKISKKEKLFGSKSETFSNSYTIPNDVNVEEISAEHKNGILVVTMPKKEIIDTENEKIKQIEIKSNI